MTFHRSASKSLALAALTAALVLGTAACATNPPPAAPAPALVLKKG